MKVKTFEFNRQDEEQCLSTIATPREKEPRGGSNKLAPPLHFQGGKTALFAVAYCCCFEAMRVRHKFIQVVRCQQRDYAGDGIAQACVAL